MLIPKYQYKLPQLLYTTR